MPDTPAPAAKLLTNGHGLWFAPCVWCAAPSPAAPAGDDLRVLAGAKAAGWRVERCRSRHGRHVLACPACAAVRGRAFPREG